MNKDLILKTRKEICQDEYDNYYKLWDEHTRLVYLRAMEVVDRLAKKLGYEIDKRGRSE